MKQKFNLSGVWIVFIRITSMLCFLVFSVGIFAQINITSSDMPSTGDTIRTSTNITTGGIDYTLTGENFNWDFGSLFPIIQTVDTFKSVTSVPFVYQLVFIPNIVANLALSMYDFDMIPGIEIEETYRFFKNSSSSFKDVGIAATVEGIPMPIKFDEPDIIYNFPLNYGDVDSCFSGVEFNLPGFVYLYIERKRINVVDGWGNLTTPFGSFDVIRIKSDIFEYDSVFIDSLGFGIAIDRKITEYKWLGNGYGIPLLQVAVEGPIVNVSYIDSVRNPITGIREETAVGSQLKIFPNPSSCPVNIHFSIDKPGNIELSIYSIYGVKLADIVSGYKQAGNYKVQFDPATLGLSKGVYLIHLRNNENLIYKKLVWGF